MAMRKFTGLLWLFIGIVLCVLRSSYFYHLVTDFTRVWRWSGIVGLLPNLFISAIGILLVRLGIDKLKSKNSSDQIRSAIHYSLRLGLIMGALGVVGGAIFGFVHKSNVWPLIGFFLTGPSALLVGFVVGTVLDTVLDFSQKTKQTKHSAPENV